MSQLITNSTSSVTLTQEEYNELTPIEGVVYMIDNGDGIERIYNGSQTVLYTMPSTQNMQWKGAYKITPTLIVFDKSFEVAIRVTSAYLKEKLVNTGEEYQVVFEVSNEKDSCELLGGTYTCNDINDQDDYTTISCDNYPEELEGKELKLSCKAVTLQTHKSFKIDMCNVIKLHGTYIGNLCNIDEYWWPYCAPVYNSLFEYFNLPLRLDDGLLALGLVDDSKTNGKFPDYNSVSVTKYEKETKSLSIQNGDWFCFNGAICEEIEFVNCPYMTKYGDLNHIYIDPTVNSAGFDGRYDRWILTNKTVNLSDEEYGYGTDVIWSPEYNVPEDAFIPWAGQNLGCPGFRNVACINSPIIGNMMFALMWSHLATENFYCDTPIENLTDIMYESGNNYNIYNKTILMTDINYNIKGTFNLINENTPYSDELHYMTFVSMNNFKNCGFNIITPNGGSINPNKFNVIYDTIDVPYNARNPLFFKNTEYLEDPDSGETITITHCTFYMYLPDYLFKQFETTPSLYQIDYSIESAGQQLISGRLSNEFLDPPTCVIDPYFSEIQEGDDDRTNVITNVVIDTDLFCCPIISFDLKNWMEPDYIYINLTDGNNVLDGNGLVLSSIESNNSYALIDGSLKVNSPIVPYNSQWYQETMYHALRRKYNLDDPKIPSIPYLNNMYSSGKSLLFKFKAVNNKEYFYNLIAPALLIESEEGYMPFEESGVIWCGTGIFYTEICQEIYGNFIDILSLNGVHTNTLPDYYDIDWENPGRFSVIESYLPKSNNYKTGSIYRYPTGLVAEAINLLLTVRMTELEYPGRSLPKEPELDIEWFPYEGFYYQHLFKEYIRKYISLLTDKKFNIMIPSWRELPANIDDLHDIVQIATNHSGSYNNQFEVQTLEQMIEDTYLGCYSSSYYNQPLDTDYSCNYTATSEYNGLNIPQILYAIEFK